MVTRPVDHDDLTDSPPTPPPKVPLNHFSEFGIPITFISSTGAKSPDDSPIINAVFKKAVESTTTAIKVTRQWSTIRRKKEKGHGNIVKENSSPEVDK